MTLTTTTNRNDYTGNGAILIFAYTFLITANADLGVYLDGVKKTLTTDYTVSGAGLPSGGNVTFVVAPGSGVAVSIIREVAYTQSVDYIENQKFPADTHESALDRVTMLCQQLLEKVGRAATFKIQSLLTNPVMADGVVGKFLRWKTTTELENIDVVTLGAVGIPVSPDQGGTGSSNTTGYLKANLPTAGIAGRLARVIDTVRGVWLDQGSQWFGLNGEVVNVKEFGAKGDGVANDTTAIQNAIAALTTGIVFFPPGTYNHTGLTLKAGVSLQGSGPASTILNNTGTGVNVTIPALANHASLISLGLTGVTGSTHGVHVIDALWVVLRDVAITSWGNSSSGVRLNTLNNPGGNGTFFTELYNLDINGQNRAGVTGLELTGTATQATHTRVYGGSIRNCTTGILLAASASTTFVGLSISGTTTGASFTGANATTSLWVKPSFEGNTTHLNIAANAADHFFLFPTFSAPLSFGINNGNRTTILTTDPSGFTNPVSLFAGAISFSGDVSVGRSLLGSTTFAALGTPVNGVMVYCSDCTIANPCAGAGAGAFAKRIAGAWVCN